MSAADRQKASFILAIFSPVLLIKIARLQTSLAAQICESFYCGAYACGERRRRRRPERGANRCVVELRRDGQRLIGVSYLTPRAGPCALDLRDDVAEAHPLALQIEAV